jgi:hypothetical protein
LKCYFHLFLLVNAVKEPVYKDCREMNTQDHDNAHMNQRNIDYVDAVAKGGAGMVIPWTPTLIIHWALGCLTGGV